MSTRAPASARSAGQHFERAIADCLAREVDDRIDIRPKNGSKDRGDIGGLRHGGLRIVVQCKDHTTMKLGPWINETDVQRGNDDAQIGLVIHKRRGYGLTRPLDQYVTMTVRDLLALLTLERPE